MIQRFYEWLRGDTNPPEWKKFRGVMVLPRYHAEPAPINTADLVRVLADDKRR